MSEVLPLVARPARYTNGEYNALHKEPGPGAVSWVLAMPEVYELGMSNYGLRILYHVINRLEAASCDRCYCPWPDFGDMLTKRGLVLCGLESKRPVRDFDILGVSLQSELSYTNLLYLLDLARIPLLRRKRSVKDPLVVAGGPCTVNPLPVAGFVDAFVVGDGEEPVREITGVYADWNHRNRDDLLAALARLPGLYVPEKTVREADAVQRRIVGELREDDYPFPPVVPICEVAHDRLTVEIARGCTRGCRFCQAGIINRPVRWRPVDQVVRLAERGIRATGWEEVSLLSLSALDYPDILGLVRSLNARLRGRRVALSLPSTRGESFTPELALDLREVKKTGLTFAPETASSRLKSVINKSIAEPVILESVRTALDAGWTGVKLYFMVGLPGETDQDADEIVRFVDEIARLCRGRAVRYSLSPFVPKPHTPLQWTGFAGVGQLQERIGRIRTRLTRRNVKAKWEYPESSYVQALLARGDERLGPVIEAVYQRGAVFQEWTERFEFQVWLEACQQAGVDPEKYVGERTPGDRLAWDFIDVGVTKVFLREEYRRALAGIQTPDCATAGCTDCGVCPERKPPARPEPIPMAEIAYALKSAARGRPVESKVRFRLKYRVGEAYRFAGHLDRVRGFYRSLRRSELPVAYTRGFAPKPMLSFGPPLPVGLVSEGEYLDVFVSSGYTGDIGTDLGPFLPRGLEILAVRPVPRSCPSLGRDVNLGRYRFKPPADLVPALDELVSQGRRIAGVRVLDQGPRSTVVMELSIVPGLRLFSVLARLLGIGESQARGLSIVREDCLVDRNERVLSPMEVK